MIIILKIVLIIIFFTIVLAKDYDFISLYDNYLAIDEGNNTHH